MKQHITKEQWDELGREEKKKFVDGLSDWSYNFIVYEIAYPTIGQMIEFLGDDFECLEKEEDKWTVCIKYYKFAEQTEFIAKEPKDALWQAVKNKLNHNK